jgi:hypothetical protein
MRTNRLMPGIRALAAAGLVTVLSAAATLAHAGAYVIDNSGSDYALIEDGSNTTLAVGASDHWDGIGRLQKEVHSTGQPVFWFSRGSHEYVVRDAKIVDRARTIVEPISALGQRQGKIGAKQGLMGARQGELGALQGRAALLQARIALGSVGSRGRERAEYDALKSDLRDLTRQMDELNREQQALGSRQRRLGDQQAVLGRQMADATKTVQGRLRTLSDDALASGAAQEL